MVCVLSTYTPTNPRANTMTAPMVSGKMLRGSDGSWSDTAADSRAAATSEGVSSGESIRPDAALEATKLDSFGPRDGPAGACGMLGPGRDPVSAGSTDSGVKCSITMGRGAGRGGALAGSGLAAGELAGCGMAPAKGGRFRAFASCVRAPAGAAGRFTAPCSGIGAAAPRLMPLDALPAAEAMRLAALDSAAAAAARAAAAAALEADADTEVDRLGTAPPAGGIGLDAGRAGGEVVEPGAEVIPEETTDEVRLGALPCCAGVDTVRYRPLASVAPGSAPGVAPGTAAAPGTALYLPLASGAPGEPPAAAPAAGDTAPGATPTPGAEGVPGTLR